jgi:guanine deaminase
MEPHADPVPTENAPRPEFMRRAIELSRHGMLRGDGGPFGAVVVRDGQIIGEGWNQVIATNDPTAHGEVVAIRHACRAVGSFVLAGCDLYTSYEPCPLCLSAIYWARVVRVFFGNTVADAAAIGFDDTLILNELRQPAGSRSLPATRFMAEEAAVVFREFLANPDRVRY